MKQIKILMILLFTIIISLNVFAAKAKRVNITSDPSGANMQIVNSPNVYTTPLRMRFKPGANYQLTFSKSGYQTQTINYAGGSGDIFVKLIPLNSKPPKPDHSEKYNLFVKCNINGAYVNINGQYYGQTPLKVRLPRGSYQVEVSMDGYQTYTAPVKLVSHQIVNANLIGYNYNLSISANVNGADVLINNQHYGKTPVNVSLSPGNYNIHVTYPGYSDYSISINLNSNQNINAQLSPQNFINLRIPKNARVFINGQKQQINWGKKDNWKTFTFYAASNNNEVVVKYFKLEVKKRIPFNGNTYQLFTDLR